MMRTEKDMLGIKELPEEVLYGIHTVRAIENFPLSGRSINKALIRAYATVKLACAQTNFEIGCWKKNKFDAIADACCELRDGLLDSHIVVDALQGGAGTSTNMNINEVIANRALQIMGEKPGHYKSIHPIEDINLHQSTNDTYPTALRVAAILEIRKLEKSLVDLLQSFQLKEKEFGHIVKVGRTQLQDAVLTTLGRSMSAYAEAFGRDRWRIYKCEERLRTINLGGTAIGTGLGAPRQYIFKVVEKLKKLTGIGLARAENLVESTQNCDALVEVSGILSACASNLLKTAGDLRMMSSGPDSGIGEINLPKLQAGSSIMPGKVNPVIPEAVSQAALTVIGNHNIIFQACSMGSLELNAFLPIIADRLLESIQLLTNAGNILSSKCISGITANENRCRAFVETSTATITTLVEKIGYETAEKILAEANDKEQTIKEAVTAKGLITPEQYEQLISAEAVTRLGSVKPINN